MMTGLWASVRRHLFTAPSFWQQADSWPGRALQPVAALYSRLVTRRAQQPARYTAPIPVICIGNFTVGGSGKTPTVQLVAEILQACGKKPAILLRGYGGSATGPLRIDITQHNARLVGDEALLHVHVAPTWIARDRAKGAQAIVASNECDCIVMDDGAQNPALHKNLTLNVVDGGAGFGNGRVLPAGPLREDLLLALQRTTAVIVIGTDPHAVKTTLQQAATFGRKPVFTGNIVAAEHLEHLQDRPLLAFAGIGRPAKFYVTLRQNGVRVAATRDFPDHHPYTGQDIRTLSAQAHQTGEDTGLITTTKDWVRIPAGFQHLVEFFPVRLQIDQIDDLTKILLSAWP